VILASLDLLRGLFLGRALFGILRGAARLRFNRPILVMILLVVAERDEALALPPFDRNRRE